jgi:transposase
MKTNSREQYVGIDIAAQTLSAAWGPSAAAIGAASEFEQSQMGYKRLIGRLKAAGGSPTQTLVVIEATGTYWMRPAQALYQAGFQVSVINPRQAYHFAQAVLRQAKTDALDAQLLAQLAASLPLKKVWQPPSEAWESLYQRLVERDNLVEMRQMLRNQLHALRQRTQLDPSVEARKQGLIDDMNAQIKVIDQELEAWLRQSEWIDMSKRLRSVKGIGLLGAAWLLVITNGFSTCEDAEQLASYLGLVPHPDQSGTSRRGHKRTGHTGQARARRVLYQGSLSAARFNPAVKALYDRLICSGKHVKTARVAATRKLVHIAFAVVTKEQFFDPHYHFSTHPLLSTP